MSENVLFDISPFIKQGKLDKTRLSDIDYVLSIVQPEFEIYLVKKGRLDKSRLSDTEYVQSTVKYELEMELKVGRFFWKKFTPLMVFTLLKEEKLDRNRLDDLEYITSIIFANLDDLLNEDTKIIIRYENLFLPYAKQVFDQGGVEAAIILVVTEIEHKLNHFYRNILPLKIHDDSTITEIIRSSMHVKMGWLMLLASDCPFPTETKTKVSRLVELRNAIVHYKFKPELLDNTNFRPFPQIAKIDFAEIIEVVDELEDVLEKIHKQIDPDNALSDEIAAKLVEYFDNLT